MASTERAETGPSVAANLQRSSGPALRCVFHGPRGVEPAVAAVIGPRGLAGLARGNDGGLLEHCPGQATSGGVSLELWVEPKLAVLVVCHAGPALPEWLIANWDRGEEPAVLDAPSGWGWLLVREALDGVSAAASGDRQLLLLEKRL